MTASRKMIFDMEEGEAILIYPDGMSPASIDDFEALVMLAIKRMRRAAAKGATADEAPPATEGGA